MRREFSLPEEDIEYLDANHNEWETTHCDGNWLLIQHFPIPKGYTVSEATIAINVSAYAPGPLDMVYVNPPLVREDGMNINCTQCAQIIHGIPFQRWSRHYCWHNDTCNLITHIAQIEEWFSTGLIIGGVEV